MKRMIKFLGGSRGSLGYPHMVNVGFQPSKTLRVVGRSQLIGQSHTPVAPVLRKEVTQVSSTNIG